MQFWLTVRMDDSGQPSIQVHGSEEYNHPHESYAESGTQPTAVAVVEIENQPQVTAFLQGIIDAAREAASAATRLAAMRAEVRAADRAAGRPTAGDDQVIHIDGNTAPTGTSTPTVPFVKEQ